MKKVLLSIISILFISTNLFAQLSGIKTIDNTLPTSGNNYNSFAAAINALNTSGVGAGGVVFNVTAGQTFNENPPEITAIGTASDSIVFRKIGAGVNPMVKPNIAGTLTTTTLGNHADGIIILNGGDYIIFDGIEIDGNNTFSTAIEKFEYGFYFKKATGVDACKNVIIRNCTITLYHSLASGSAVTAGSGIFISNILGTSSATVTSIGGRTENIKIMDNTFTGCYTPIQVRGFAAIAPYDFYDQNISITGNNIIDYGGGTGSSHTVFTTNVNNLVIFNNTFLGGGSNTGAQYGIYCSTAINSNIDITNNTFTLVNGTTTGSLIPILLTTGTTIGTNNAINVTDNIFTNFTRPNVTSGVTYIIQSTSNYPNILNISGNTISNMNFNSTGNFYVIYQISNPVNFIVANNTITNISRTSASGTGSVWAIYNSSTATGAAFTASGNTINNISTTTGGSVAGIAISTSLSSTVFNNKIYNLSTGGSSATAYGINILGSSPNVLIYNNFISNLRTPDALGANTVIGINSSVSAANTSIAIYYNSIYLNAVSTALNFGSSGISCVGSATATSGTLDLQNNIIINLSTPNGTGVTTALRRTNVNLANYSSSSNYNNFYAGTPSSVSLIFFDGTNRDSTLQDYKLRAAPRDTNSVSKAVFFVNSTNGDLHLTGTSNGDTELGALPISGITTDFDGDIRSITVPYKGADEAPIPLPVELSSFTSMVSERDIILNWETKSEINSAAFSIERSIKDKNEWIQIGNVKAAVNSLSPVYYAFIDKKLNTGVFNYRLKMTDLDGSFKYSSVIEAEIGMPTVYSLSQNYPNPFNPSTKIDYQLPYDANVTIELFSVTGEKVSTLVNQEQPAGYYTINVSSSSINKNLASGMYIFRMTAKDQVNRNSFMSIKKMILLK